MKMPEIHAEDATGREMAHAALGYVEGLAVHQEGPGPLEGLERVHVVGDGLAVAWRKGASPTSEQMISVGLAWRGWLGLTGGVVHLVGGRVRQVCGSTEDGERLTEVTGGGAHAEAS